ncbi:TonB-dependent receptor P26 [Dyadobacter sp. CECT 9275]|uniref:TonB-dependent receptor P26 n=1 Tax=Dyadobacter helix TaxID=2822344 RepID=A0A916J919_9BACT|nr:TonB-dependent receptor [Dyadobacter sp. CECT 9275]CAG4991626.1 TonB-dependent receptor P26 [Dyadobacter sp. CECT 9275]
MKKTLITAKQWHTIMKISTVQIFMVFFLTSVVWGKSSAQEMLNHRIHISSKDTPLRTVLSEISKTTGIRISYNSKVVSREQIVSVHAKNEKLVDVLDNLLLPLNITYIVLEKQIVLRKLEPAPQQKKSQDPAQPSSSNERTINGTVTDEAGEPLPGVNIVLRGSSRGTTTSKDGKYTLDLPEGDNVLIFSFVGYIPQEIIIGKRTAIDVTLKVDTKALEEVVVVGYGTVQKKDLTGSVSSMQGDALATRKTTQISQALQGAMPGVMVTRNNNAPGATATIRVRGITTITDAGANPLIILDGVPVDDINSINPNDVDNISVLKDAASASIYGSRAAAGVILVTTKRAKEGQLNLDYTVEYGLDKPTKLPKYVNAQRFMQLTNELRWNDNGNNSNEYPTYSKDLITNYPALHAENPDQYPNTDWKRLILNNTAPRRSHILSISAAGKALKSRVSLGYDKSDALYDNRTYERITARVNNDVTITKYLSASIDINFKRTLVDQPVTDPINRMNVAPPIYAAMWSDGRVGAGKDGANIYGLLKYGGANKEWYNQVGGKLSLDFSPIEGLKFSGILSPFLNFDKAKYFTKKIPYTSWNNPGNIAGYLEGGTETKLAETRKDNYRYTTQFLANYSKQLGSHHLDLLAGYEYYHAFNEDLSASRGQYILTNYPYLNLGPLEFRDNGGNAFENAYRSWFGRVMYNYKDKYLFQANVRFDGSSRFAPGYRWGSFPSVSAGWVISEENFMPKNQVLSFLKVRASWGSLGNERIGNYPYQALLSFENSSLFYKGNTAVSAQAAAQYQYAIRDISWETTQSFDMGLDVNFFNDRLKLTADYYKKTTKDMLLELEIPDYIGFDNPDQNTGKMYTTGWEMQVGWNDKAGDVGYRFSFNLSDFVSKMGDLGGTVFLGDQIKKMGSQFNEWYGYKAMGLYQTQDEVDNSAKLNTNVRPGDIRYQDISGPEGKPDGKISPEYDRVLLGGSLPRLIFGANLGASYKNFDLSVVLQGVGKQNSRISTSMVQPLLENYGNFPEILDGQSWSRYNTDAQNLAAKYPRYTNTSAGNNFAMSDFWLINGGYLRLKNISLSYQVPRHLTEKIRIQGLRLYSTVTDLFSAHRFPKGWDPEMGSFTYPITTSFVFGASIKF